MNEDGTGFRQNLQTRSEGLKMAMSNCVGSSKQLFSGSAHSPPISSGDSNDDAQEGRVDLRTLNSEKSNSKSGGGMNDFEGVGASAASSFSSEGESGRSLTGLFRCALLYVFSSARGFFAFKLDFWNSFFFSAFEAGDLASGLGTWGLNWGLLGFPSSSLTG